VPDGLLERQKEASSLPDALTRCGIYTKECSVRHEDDASRRGEGENILRFSRNNPPQYGLAIKDFTLTPISGRASQKATKR
jgi:hypothetical protein